MNPALHHSSADGDVRVVYVMGYGHSGSTILGALLGQADGVEDVGELANLLRPGWRENKPCACGTKVRSCVFWEAVIDRWKTLTGERDLAALRTLQMRFDRSWMSWLRLRRNPERDPVFARYGRLVGALYRSIAEVSGRRVIVDSSKSFGRARSLARIPGIDLRLIHLVRDGRAVAWSLRRKKKQRPVVRSAVAWRFHNLVCNRLRERLPAERTRLLRYEDLVFRTDEALRGIGDCIGIDLRPVLARIARSEPIGFRHEVAGNRVRRRSGVVLSPDVAWTRDMPERWQRMIGRLNRKMLRDYDYA